ncbi:MAG: hypothetical protein CME06_11605 [Gemmatimonadetes bacterium]|nr:hypothetical protein [Gemmatimonadota bacterium]
MTLDELEQILAAFEEEEVEYVVIGGAAVNAHGLIRATEDIDVMIRPTAENVDRLRRSLRSIWDDPSIDEIRAEELAGEYPALRYVPPEGELYLDIVARFGDAFGFDDIESQRMELGRVAMTVATPLALYRMKKDTVREVDRADASALRRRFDIDDPED